MKKIQFAAMVAISALVAVAPAAASDSAMGNATANVLLPISISAGNDLAFGAFASNTGGVVYVTAGGTRSVSSGAVALYTSGPGAAASFDVTGEPDATYAITLPADGTVTITSGLLSMAVDAFESDQAGNAGTLSTLGAQTINVGAKLTVNSAQTAGSYSGTYSVAVEYN